MAMLDNKCTILQKFPRIFIIKMSRSDSNEEKQNVQIHCSLIGRQVHLFGTHKTYIHSKFDRLGVKEPLWKQNTVKNTWYYHIHNWKFYKRYVMSQNMEQAIFIQINLEVKFFNSTIQNMYASNVLHKPNIWK